MAPSKYLARVASKSPEQVLDVILAISTSNERVHEDFGRAAAAMPASLGRRWANASLQWVDPWTMIRLLWLQLQSWLRIFPLAQFASYAHSLNERGEDGPLRPVRRRSPAFCALASRARILRQSLTSKTLFIGSAHLVTGLSATFCEAKSGPEDYDGQFRRPRPTHVSGWTSG
jgi:hypothetical protein